MDQKLMLYVKHIVVSTTVERARDDSMSNTWKSFFEMEKKQSS